MYEKLKDFLTDDFWIMPATPKYIDKGIPYITSKNIKNGKIDYSNINYISNEDYENISKNRPIKVNDILISMIGTIGETAVVTKNDGKFYGQNMFLVRLNDKKINQRFFLNYFKSNFVKNQLFNKQNKSTQSYLKANHIEDLKVPVISVEEQIKIANKLDKIQMMIDEKKEQISLLNQLIKSQFVEMFGDPITNEKNWNTDEINKVAPSKNYKGEFDSNRVWLLNLDMVESNTGRIIDYLYENIDSIGNSTCCFSEENVLFSKLRPYLNKVVMPVKKGFATSEMVPLLPDKNKLNRTFLTYLLRSNSFVDYISIKVSGAKMPRVIMEEFRKYKIILPPIELQNKFAQIVEQIDKQKFEFEKSLKKLEELQASLMQEYFG